MIYRCTCGQGFFRVHRTALQRAIYSEAHRCKLCDRTSFRIRRWLFVSYSSLFAAASPQNRGVSGVPRGTITAQRAALAESLKD